MGKRTRGDDYSINFIEPGNRRQVTSSGRVTKTVSARHVECDVWSAVDHSHDSKSAVTGDRWKMAIHRHPTETHNSDSDDRCLHRPVHCASRFATKAMQPASRSS